MLVIPPVALLLALIADLSSGPPPARSKEEEEFGVVPLVAVAAAPLVAVPPVGAAVAGIAAVGLTGYLLYRLTQNDWRKTPDITWPVFAAATAASTVALATSLRHAGLKINTGCAWIFQPAGILGQFVGIIRRRAHADKIVTATMGKGAIDSTLDNAAARAAENLRLRMVGGSALPGRLPGLSWVVEGVYLVLQLVLFLKGSPLLEVAIEAFQELMDAMMACFDSVRKFWPYEIGRVLGSLFGVFRMLGGLGIKNLFLRGAAGITLIALASLFDDVVLGWIWPHGFGDEDQGNAMNWMQHVVENEELPKEIIDVTDKARPGDRLTETVGIARPEGFELRLVAYEAPSLTYFAEPDSPTMLTVPTMSYWVYVKPTGREGWLKAKQIIPLGALLDTRVESFTYIFELVDGQLVISAWDGNDKTPLRHYSPQELEPTHEGLSTRAIESIWATWEATPGYDLFLQNETIPGKKNWGESRFKPGKKIPPGTYRLMIQHPGAEPQQVAPALYLVSGEHYKATVHDVNKVAWTTTKTP